MTHGPPVRPPPHTVVKVKSMLDAEFAKCDIRGGPPGDDGATTYYFFKNHNDDFGPLLKLLYWRGRQQSAIYDVYEQLCMRGFIQAYNVGLPMAINRSSESVQNLTWLLMCFEGPAKSYSSPGIEKLFPLQDDDFSLPLQWLATMIVRSSADNQDLPRTILASRYLGDIDDAKFCEYMKYCPFKVIQYNPEEGRCAPDLPGQFGFWLPHGIRTSPDDVFALELRKCIARFNRIEECFQEWFGFKPEEVYTEAQQMEFFEAHPNLLPE
ncbi:MAG: hypothetical protein LQ338_006642 [Usnochroma carphineum]|nr:MAG: hypothetical protein LQ338_006642 [Usnochroma carphineum]